MSRYITTAVSKFMWKNKVLIPCVLFTASFVMLTKMLRHGSGSGLHGPKQPVEFLETIEFPDRKLGRNQLSWNEMEKVDQNALFKDIYKDFRAKGKREFDGEGYVRVKGDGQVEVVEGYERDAWGARTYDPLALLPGQSDVEIDLETIDGFVIKAPGEAPAMKTSQRVQSAQEHGEFQDRGQVLTKKTGQGFYSIKSQQVAMVQGNTDVAGKTKTKKKKKQKLDPFVKPPNEPPVFDTRRAVQDNEVLLFNRPPTDKPMAKHKSKMLSDRNGDEMNAQGGVDSQAQPRINQYTVRTNVIDDTRGDDKETVVIIKAKRMGKKKRRKKPKKPDVLPKGYQIQLNSSPRNSSVIAPHKFAAQGIEDKRRDSSLLNPVKDQNSMILNFQTNSDTKNTDNAGALKFNQNQERQTRNGGSLGENEALLFKPRDPVRSRDQYSHAGAAANGPHLSNDVLQRQSQNQRNRQKQRNMGFLLPGDRAARTQGSNADAKPQRHQTGSALRQNQNNVQFQRPQNVFGLQPMGEGDGTLKQPYSGTAQGRGDKSHAVLQQHNLERRTAGTHHTNSGRHKGEPLQLTSIPVPSLGSLISQQRLMLDVQREISQQYAQIQELQSRLTIANYAAKGMVHQPHALSDHQPPRAGHDHTLYFTRNRTADVRHANARRDGNVGGDELRVRSVHFVQAPPGGSRGETNNEHDRPQTDFRYKAFETDKVEPANDRGDGGGGWGGTDHGGAGGGGLSKRKSRRGKSTKDRHNAKRAPGFKLKHKRKPKNLLLSNQTRVYSFQTQHNDSGDPHSWLNTSADADTQEMSSNLTLFSSFNSTLDLAGIRQKLQKLSDKTSDAGKFTRRLSRALYRDARVPVDVFGLWQHGRDTLCPDSEEFEGYDDKFARLHNVLIDKKFSDGRAGGENISDVINQAESAEYYKVYRGFFTVYCRSEPRHGDFIGNHHINEWYYALETTQDRDFLSDRKFKALGARSHHVTRVDQFTIAVVRYEYANLYHTMTDFFNAFLMMEFFNKTQVETNILLVDGHPHSNLDSTWRTLFNSSTRIGDLPQKTVFTDLVWSMVGYESPMNDHYMMSLPLVEEFRTFFLSTYGLANSAHALNCDSLSVLFIWRRDYVAHPRNPSGFIQRKVQNEQELVTQLRKKFTNHTIRGVQIDLFDMRQQLDFIVNTDILIGMHGAGLTHSLFLPKHAGIIELIPNYWSSANMHFEAIATWRNLYFDRWTNEDPQNEAPNYSTIIPPEIVMSFIQNMMRPMCNQSIDQSVYHGPGAYNVNNNNNNNNNQDPTQGNKGIKILDD